MNQIKTEDRIRDAAITAASAANEMKAVDILVQEVGPYIGITDYFVFATARNPRQAEAIIDKIEEDLRIKDDLKPLNRELATDGSWSLLDYGDIIVHILSEEARGFYRIEQIWPDAPMLDLESAGGLSDLEYSDRGRALLADSESLT